MYALGLTLVLSLPLLVIVAALRDLTTMTIPNWISLTLAGLFPLAALATGLSPLDMLTHAGVGAAALAIGIGLFALRLLGGGDVKLMAAVCLWLGLAGVTPFVLWTAMAGGVLSIGLIVGRARAPALAAAGPAWLGRLMTPNGDIPYGLAIAAGALAAFPQSPMVLALAAG